MSAAGDLKKINRIVNVYKRKLGGIEDALFQRTPAIGGWSYSEVYFHIFDASILTLAELRSCTEGVGKVRPTAFLVKLILFFGRLPPGRKFKAPKVLTSRLRLITKTEAEELMNAFLSQLAIDYKTLDKADKHIKTLHPRMGYFNAGQWLRFIMIHLDHHLRQLKQIEKSFI